MEWRDLCIEVKSTLELCWGLYDDNPRSITREIGKEFTVYLGVSHIPHSVTHLFTEDSYQQILEYQKSDPCFDVKREGNLVTCTGKGGLGELCEARQFAESMTLEG
jgi:hypothetical protein